MKRAGIYIYYFNNKVVNSYIGSTRNFDRRHKDHMRELRANTHPNYVLQAAYNKYGEDTMVYNELEEMKFPSTYGRGLIKQHLEARELYWQESLHCRYILVKAGCGQRPNVIRKAAKARMRKVYELDHLNNIIVEYDSVTDAADKTGIHYGRIMNAINLRSSTSESCGGRIFRSKDTIGKSRRGEGKGTFRAKKIKCYDLMGNFLKKYSAINRAAIELSLDSSSITGCCQRKFYFSGQYQFRYANDVQDVGVGVKKNWKRYANALMDKMSTRKPFC